MASENGRYTAARIAFEKAKKNTAVRSSVKVCGQTGNNGVPCAATGIYVEEFRGDRYHFEGTCELGHTTERYGYADSEVVDP